MSGTEATTTDGGTSGTTETRHDASTAAEQLGGPLEDEQSRDTGGQSRHRLWSSSRHDRRRGRAEPRHGDRGPDRR